MRISTAQIYTQGVKAFGVQQTKLSDLQVQISTGTRINKPSDDPAASARILELEQVISLNNQFQTNINLAENRLNLEESTMASVDNIMLRIRELALQGNNASQDNVSRNAIATEVEELGRELLSLSNTIDSNGDYLFAGHQSKTQPFTLTDTGSIAHVQFNGDEGERFINISQSRQINVDTPGRELFMQVESNTALNERADPANAGTSVLAPAHVYDQANYVPGDYQIVFDTVSAVPDTIYSVVDSLGVTVASGTYVDSTDIDFMGIRTSVAGVPANGDTYTVSQGQYQDVFEIVSNLVETLKTGQSTTQTAGSYTFGSAVTAFDYSVDSASFDVDGFPVVLDANYTDLDGVSAEIQADLDATAGAGIYTVTNDGARVTITNVALGAASTAPVVNNFNGDVDANGAVGTSGIATTAAVSVFDYTAGVSDISFDVDGFAVVLDANYINLAGVTAEVQADLNNTAGPGVYNVTDNGTNIIITKVVTGAVSTAPVINNPAGTGANQAEFTGAALINGVDATNTIADFTLGGIALNGVEDGVIHDNMAQSLLDIDSGFIQVLEARTSIGGRLNALEAQFDDNDSLIRVTQKTLGILRDTDLAEAISQLSLEQVTLDAAQAVFAKITSSSLFNFLR